MARHTCRTPFGAHAQCHIHSTHVPVRVTPCRAVEESRKKLAGANGDTSGSAVADAEASGGTRESNAELLAELEALRRKKDAAEKKHLALGKIFSTQLAEFKEVVTRATGYQINSCGGGIGVNDGRSRTRRSFLISLVP